ncbi:hypothetical protein, partial [Microbacterium sp. K41]|uniref:hypothetical protein n=1 Tax=Microbacterium sp. K41 TaxID=2305437 RepID=UPI00197C4C11
MRAVLAQVHGELHGRCRSRYQHDRDGIRLIRSARRNAFVGQGLPQSSFGPRIRETAAARPGGPEGGRVVGECGVDEGEQPAGGRARGGEGRPGFL